jgi:hypothetical protein
MVIVVLLRLQCLRRITILEILQSLREYLLAPFAMVPAHSIRNPLGEKLESLYERQIFEKFLVVE